WLKQTKDTPSFDDLLWSRPDNNRFAGYLSIVGGNSFVISEVGEEYAAAMSVGAGSVRVILPLAVRKVVGNVIEHAEFAASNLSGGFSSQAFGEIMDHSDWADGIVLAGDFGKNSETAILLENLLSKTTKPIT